MWNALRPAALAVLLLFIFSCGQPDNAKDNMAKQTYSLCPTHGDSRQKLYGLVKSFADEQGARFIDRSSGAQQELADMGSDVLKKTGGELILITVEKPGEFRVTVSNAGLKEKFGLAVRSLGGAGDVTPVSAFMANLSRFWVIEEVERSVENDPPCE